jgi:2-methylcitrate dehydratase
MPLTCANDLPTSPTIARCPATLAPRRSRKEVADLDSDSPLTVKTTDGKTYSEELKPSKGSPRNPVSHDELEDKFIGLATTVLPPEQASKIPATVRNLEEIKELGDLVDLLVSPPA